MRRRACLGVLAFALLTGCSKSRTPGGVFAIEPYASAPGQRETVRLRGFGEAGKDTVSLDFGAGVTASATIVEPGMIVADVVVASDAALGPRTIRLTQGSVTRELENAFEIVREWPVATAEAD